MDKTGTNPLADIPESVVDAVSRALRRLADLERQRAGYKRMGLGDRFDADLDAAGAFARDTVTEFRSCAAANGVDADAAIAAMGGAS